MADYSQINHLDGAELLSSSMICAAVFIYLFVVGGLNMEERSASSSSSSSSFSPRSWSAFEQAPPSLNLFAALHR